MMIVIVIDIRTDMYTWFVTRSNVFRWLNFDKRGNFYCRKNALDGKCLEVSHLKEE